MIENLEKLCNRKFPGYNMGDGQELSGVLDPDSYMVIKSILKKKKELEKKSFSITLELGLTHKNGSIVNTETSITGFFGISRDITDRKKSEKGAMKIYDRFIKIIEKIPHGLLLFNSTGEIIFYNSSFSRMLGHSTVELCNKSIIQLTFEDDRMETEDLINSLKSGQEEVCSFRSRLVRHDSYVIWVKETILIFEKKGEKTIFLGIFEDIN